MTNSPSTNPLNSADAKAASISTPSLQPGASFAPLGNPAAQLTPLDVQHQEFATSWRGYRKGDVRAYLSEVAQALEASLRERAHLTQRLEDVQRQVQDYRNAEDELRRTVVAAERIGHELKEQSRHEALLTIQDAENRAALLTEAAKTREQEALSRHEARLRELESTFSVRRAQLESLYQAQEHELENRARERSAALEREFSARYADLSGRLSAAHAEYAQFMSQYRAVSQAFAQAANTHLLPDTPGLPNRRIGDAASPPTKAPASNAAVDPRSGGKDLSPEAAAVQIEEQRFS